MSWGPREERYSGVPKGPVRWKVRAGADAGRGGRGAGPTDCTPRPGRDALGPGAEGPRPGLRRATMGSAVIRERVPAINAGARDAKPAWGGSRTVENLKEKKEPWWRIQMRQIAQSL